MTYLGVVMLVIGSLGLFASLIGLASLGLDRKTVRRYGVPSLRWSFIVAVVSVLLAVLGLIVGGARNISDSLGILMLAGSLIVIVVAPVLLIVSSVRSGASRIWAILTATVVALVAGGSMWLGASWDDFTSSLILFGFGLPLVGAATGLLWLIVPLIRRRGRLNTVTFVWSAASLATVGVVAITILTVPDRLTGANEKASLSAIFPAASGWSPELLNIAFDYAKELRSTSVIVIKDGELVAEWGKTDKRTSAHSVRKSLLSALYGIAAEKGLMDINSTLEELGVDDQNPPLFSQEKKARLVDLLKSRSGIYHDSVRDDSGDERPERGAHAPDTFFFYNNWSFNALGTIFEQGTGLTMGEAFKQWIADPVGMQDFEARDVKYEFSGESVFPAYRFWVSARDMARFGVLFEQEGRWKGQQLVPPDWIQESTVAYSVPTRFGYGYSWWTSLGHLEWISDTAYLASGTGGQKLLIDPDRELVVVHRVDTGKNVTRGLWFDYGQSVNNPQFLELVRLIVAASPEA